MNSRISVLCVDDDPSEISLCKAFLECGGDFIVDGVQGAKEALERLKTKTFDAIVSDYSMPVMDGFALLEKIRISGNNNPFILFTGKGHEDLAVDAFSMGVAAYLKKGVDPKTNFTELKRLIRQSVEAHRVSITSHEAQQRVEDILDFFPDPTFALDQERKVIAWNRAIVQMTGVPAEKMMGRGHYSYSEPFYSSPRPLLADLLFSWDDDIARSYGHIVHEGPTLITETVKTTIQGKEISLWIKASPLLDSSGVVNGAIETIRDVTTLRKALVSLRDSEDKYRKLFNVESDALFVVDVGSGLILEVNVSAERLYGYDHGELVGKPESILTAGDHEGLSGVRDIHRKVSVTRHQRKDGTIFPVEITIGFLNLQNRPARVVAVRDISHRLLTETALEQANKKLNLLQSITRHDILNKVTVLLINLKIARNAGSEEELESMLGMAEHASHAIQRIIEFTRDYQELGIHTPAWQDLAEVIERSRSMIDMKGIALRYQDENIQVLADPLFERVCYALLDNAVRYGMTLSTITIGCRFEGDTLVVIFEDDGAGIDPGDKEKIFEQGYGKGTGLGLFLVREILSITSMTIKETGKPPGGARFEITVPEGRYRIKAPASDDRTL